MTVPINTTESLDRSLSERLNQAIDPTSEPDVLTEACETTSGSATKPNIDPALTVSAGMIVDRDEVNPNTDAPVLRRAAMDFLARREHSLHELLHKLSLKFPEVESALLAEVLNCLAAENLQSDERFTECYVRYRKSRGFGYLHIKADLSQRGVSQALIDSKLYPDDEDWALSADQLVCKRLGENEKLEFGAKPHRKMLRFLKSRGFTASETRKALESRLK